MNSAPQRLLRKSEAARMFVDQDREFLEPHEISRAVEAARKRIARAVAVGELDEYNGRIAEDEFVIWRTRMKGPRVNCEGLRLRGPRIVECDARLWLAIDAAGAATVIGAVLADDLDATTGQYREQIREAALSIQVTMESALSGSISGSRRKQQVGG